METIDSKERVKKSRVDRAIDYLKEQAYLSDIDLKEDDCYQYFFEQLYDYFETKEILEIYTQSMFEFVSKCVQEQKEISVKNLIKKLYLLKFEEQEIENLKSTIQVSKTKVLVQNN